MKRFAWLISLLMALAGVAGIIVFSELQSWGSAATTWALAAALAAPTLTDFAVVHLRRRSIRRRESGGAAHPAK